VSGFEALPGLEKGRTANPPRASDINPILSSYEKTPPCNVPAAFLQALPLTLILRLPVATRSPEMMIPSWSATRCRSRLRIAIGCGRGGSFARSHRGGTALLNIALRQRSSARDCVTVTRGFSLVHKQSHSRYHPVSRVVAPRRHPAHLAVLAARRRVHTNSRASPVGRRARRAGRSPSAAKRRASVLDAAIV
jgi:hypothetical protein